MQIMTIVVSARQKRWYCRVPFFV